MHGIIWRGGGGRSFEIGRPKSKGGRILDVDESVQNKAALVQCFFY